MKSFYTFLNENDPRAIEFANRLGFRKENFERFIGLAEKDPDFFEYIETKISDFMKFSAKIFFMYVFAL